MCYSIINGNFNFTSYKGTYKKREKMLTPNISIFFLNKFMDKNENKNNVLLLHNISSKGNNVHLRFKESIKVKTFLKGNMYFCEIPELKVYVCADTIDELRNEIYDDLLDSWNEIAEYNDDELNPKAVEFKKLLNERIEKL